nr:hypothetical protein [Cellulomonas endometrii]
MRQQRADGVLVEVHPSGVARRRLGRSEREVPVLGLARSTGERAAVDLHHLLPDHQDAGVEVDVLPPQPARLTAAQAGERDELEHRPEPVGRGVVEERAELGGFPRADLRALRLRQ